MVDIVPGNVLARVSPDARDEMEAKHNLMNTYNQMPTSGPSDFQVMPELGSRGPQKNRAPLFSILAIVFSLIIGGVVLFIFKDNVAMLFQGNDASFSVVQDASYSTIDEDNDGLTTLEELASGTLVNDPDTDKDGLPDGYEIATGLSPLNPLDAAKDADDDDLNNADEFIYQTDINDPDTDKDGFKDGAEVKNGFNPNGPGELPERDSENFVEPLDQASVVINGDSFTPSFLRIEAGDVVTFINADNISHSVSGPEIETGNILPGEEFILEFSTEGEFEFFDKDDEKYAGKIIVEQP